MHCSVQGQLYAISYKGLERPWILVSVNVLDPILCGYQGTNEFWGHQKLYADFLLEGSALLNPGKGHL